MTIIYILFILLALYYSIKYNPIEIDDPHKRHRLGLLCAFLICISGFSYGLGADKFVYMNDFDTYTAEPSYWLLSISQQLLLSGYMPLWTLLNLIIKYIFNSFYVLQFVQAIFVNTIVCIVARKYTNRYMLVILLYFLSGIFFRFNTEVMREAIAIGLCLIAIDSYFNKSYVQCILWIGLAVLFHVSAIIILIFFIPYPRINLRRLVYIQILAFFMWLFSDILISYVVPLIFGGVGGMVEKIATYMSFSSSFFGFLRNYLVYLGMPSIVLYFTVYTKTDVNYQERKEKFAAFIIITGIIACSLAGFSRFANYSKLFYLIFLADFIYDIFVYQKHMIIRLASILMIAGLNIWFNFTYWPQNRFYYYQFFIPYTCILDEDPHVFVRESAHSEAVDSSNAKTRNIKF